MAYYVETHVMLFLMKIGVILYELFANPEFDGNRHLMEESNGKANHRIVEQWRRWNLGVLP